jgi:cytochrome c553
MMKRLLLPVIALALGVIVALSACSSASSTPESTPLPTATIIPTFSFDEPTPAPSVATAAAATLAAAGSQSLDPEAVERGQGRYEALECGLCHGTHGEGTDKGTALTTLTLSEEDFISFMRSGGELGTDHQYSTNRLSDSGGRNLYQYLLSLQSES